MIEKVLQELLKSKKISKHAYKTYMGQVRSGNAEGCIIGLKRKKLITDTKTLELA